MKISRIILAIFLAVIVSGTASGNTNQDFKNLGALYSAKDGWPAYKQELIDSVEERDPLVLWETLWEDSEPNLLASRSLALIEVLCPEGDLHKLSEVKGFLVEATYDGGTMIIPPSYPKQVVVVQAALVAASALSETGDYGASWIANDIFDGLKANQHFKKITIDSDPEGMPLLNEALSSARKMIETSGVRPFPFGDRLNGTLPLNLKKLREYKEPITMANASSRKMAMVNDKGELIAETGKYAWDWKETGHTFLVLAQSDSDSDPQRPQRPGRPGLTRP